MINLIKQGLAAQQAIVDANAEYINQHESQEAVNEKREVDIERIADESMLKDGEFSPLNVDNIIEALRNMPNVDMTWIAMSLATAIELKDNTYAADLLVISLKKFMTKFWQNCALIQARKNYKD
jgi:flagellar basal body rod protein FlgC